MVQINADSPDQIVSTSRSFYSPSLFDRLFDWVDALPGPAAVYYLALGVFLFALNVAIQLASGNTQAYVPWLVLISFVIPLNLFVISLLDHRAEEALEHFLPLMECSPDEISRLRSRIKDMPFFAASMSLIFGMIIGSGFLVALPIDLRLTALRLAPTDLSIHVNQALFILMFGHITLFIYHIRSQLQVVRDIFRHYTKVDLFRLGPVYTFSQIGAINAISISGVTYLWFNVIPPPLLTPTTVIAFIIFLLISAVTFFLPLLDIHALLAREKAALLDANASRMQAVVAELHMRVHAGSFQNMDDLYKTLHSVEIEHQAIYRIPTWPWQPETARLVLAAVFLPVALWLLQQLLARILTP